MRFVRPDINIDFIGKQNIAFVLSLIMLSISIISIIAHRGLNYGIDFAGGSLIQIKFEKQIRVERIKSVLISQGFEISTVQSFGKLENNEFLVKINKITTKASLAENVKVALDTIGNVQIRRVEMVGPQIGKELREKALFAMFYALLLITVYISGRFEFKWTVSCVTAICIMGLVYFLSFFKISVPFLMISALSITLLVFWFMKFGYAMGATIALIHDVIIIVGIFSIFNKEISLSTIAALLTTVGYSLNDSIIVFDRIRENLRKNQSQQFSEVINRSINETLSRTVLTSLTTLMVVLTLLILGGGIIHDFAFALAIGVIVGTYSSVYVASPILLLWQKRKI